MSGHSPRRRRPTLAIPVPRACREMIERGALAALNVSGGKDSQAMGLLLARIVPHDQLVAVHAPLGELEWPGTIEHIRDTIPPDVPLILAPVTSGKTLLQRAEERGKFPGPRQRWCTGDFKSSPVARELRRYLKDHPRFEVHLIGAMGLRRDESVARAKRVAGKRNDRMSVAGREVFDWLPIFDLTTEDVFRVIRDAGQSPHWIYAHGVTRCSCSFCIFGSKSDLRRAADGTAPRPLPRLRSPGAAHRPHPVAVGHALAGADRHSAGPARSRRSGRTEPRLTGPQVGAAATRRPGGRRPHRAPSAYPTTR